MKEYDHKQIEKKWQEQWSKKNLHKTAKNTDKPKCYVLDMFPYPSGEGLHVGHPKGYIATDIYSRYKKMTGYSVLHPMGWDAFGLPAENFAIKNKIQPRIAVEQNIKHFKEQLSLIGFNYDWEREINTTDPSYYRWTQWIFLKLYERGLAYESHEPINWCPTCQTGLANEDLEGNVCERCQTIVEKRPMRQWVLKITDYAERLLKDLDGLEWPESIKESQRNWIGRSEGALIKFPISNFQFPIEVFTTRPDTLFGATYMVIAPEHKLIQELLAGVTNREEVGKYIEGVKKKTEIERTAEGKEKTGVELQGI
ncbi:MAG: class I tRNA ligase family protein, partial [Candidatus Yonathbacteria bacterium]|nr:class I tRNA ligase family protein [Candidatus Yonathbacteria bacterium]